MNNDKQQHQTIGDHNDHYHQWVHHSFRNNIIAVGIVEEIVSNNKSIK